MLAGVVNALIVLGALAAAFVGYRVWVKKASGASTLRTRTHEVVPPSTGGIQIAMAVEQPLSVTAFSGGDDLCAPPAYASHAGVEPLVYKQEPLVEPLVVSPLHTTAAPLPQPAEAEPSVDLGGGLQVLG